MGGEVERQGGRAFRRGEMLGMRDGAMWVDIEVGDPRAVRGGKEGWLGRCVGGFKGKMMRTAGLVVQDMRGVGVALPRRESRHPVGAAVCADVLDYCHGGAGCVDCVWLAADLRARIIEEPSCGSAGN